MSLETLDPGLRRNDSDEIDTAVYGLSRLIQKLMERVHSK